MYRWPLDRILNKFMPFLARYGMERENIKEVYADWQRQFPTGSANDFIWGIFNRLLHEVAERAVHVEWFHQHQRAIYWEMCNFLKVVENKKPDITLVLFHEQCLQHANSRNFKMMAKVLTTPGCDVCDGMVYENDIESELKKMVLPIYNCPQPLGCTCIYTFIVLRDANGRTISKTNQY